MVSFIYDKNIYIHDITLSIKLIKYLEYFFVYL